MRRIATLLAGTGFVIATPALATTPDAPAAPAPEAATAAAPTAPIATDPATDAAVQSDAAATAAGAGDADIVVTARKRSETLLNVPGSVSSVSGDTIERRGLNSVREVAALTPGLNVNSDGAGRAFVAIRGVGVTLVSTVQPGVGLFIDGIYQPNTAFLNNPLTDVERIEVLRGPQGTLYGKNTLGGAINIISRAPGNDLRVHALGSYAGPDDAWTLGASVSGAIVPDVFQARLAFSHREQDGFVRNVVIGGDANPFESDSLNGTIRLRPGADLTLTINGYYDWIDGVSIPYARVTGPRDYSRDIQFNSLNSVSIDYRGINAKLDIPVESIGTTISLIGAYDARNSVSPDNDVDFGPLNIARGSGRESQRTSTAELRLDTRFNEQFSTLIGAFYSRETFRAVAQTRILPLARIVDQTNNTEADTYAVFGTLFWRPNDAWEVAAGLRYDHEDRDATGTALVNGAGGDRVRPGRAPRHRHPPLEQPLHELCLGGARLSRRRIQRPARAEPDLYRRLGLDLRGRQPLDLARPLDLAVRRNLLQRL
jgi:iron complex outermembrane receptor protein